MIHIKVTTTLVFEDEAQLGQHIAWVESWDPATANAMYMAWQKTGREIPIRENQPPSVKWAETYVVRKE